MMNKKQTWRDLLGQIISDAREKQRLANALRVNPITLNRWATNKSSPREESLRRLVNTLSHYQQEMIELIANEYPHLFSQWSATTVAIAEIPSAFYTRILNAYTSSPPIIRSSSVSTLILQQMLAHLDPRQVGMNIEVTQCTPPSPGQKIRSLRKIIERGTYPWDNPQDTEFMGAESQTGQAVISGHLVVLQNQQEKKLYYPGQDVVDGESIAAYPILFSASVAGCLTISSTQKNYFSQKLLDLIQNYADLMTLAFETHQFYPLHQIALQVMPDRQKQRPHIANFQSCVTSKLLQAAQEGRNITRPQAELQVWQEIEEKLLHLYE